MTLKGRVAIFASIATGAFVLAGVTQTIDDAISFRGQPSPWIGAFVLAGWVVGLCAWVCLFFVTPQRPPGWRPRLPWTIRRAAPLLALGAMAVAAVAYGLHLAADLLAFAGAVVVQ